ncbi:hypothetical protein BJ508DRAFT_372481 [Ascobolus immersus RN42]|uniref:Rhodopsin domain-containing protein n=1 Tax=Ascobolus immersus RN42 TaxID=1160509 RepID=A0A3N4IPS2_ASCIM|nr:hypothetical protein BJ508DRAFT_372481 [Ascobolus immersus RN42]
MPPHFTEGSTEGFEGFGGNGGNGTWGDWGAFGGNGTTNGTMGDWGAFGGNGTGFGNNTFGGFGANGTFQNACSPDPWDLSCLMPPGAVVDFNDMGQGPKTRRIAVALAAAATVAVAFRLWSRKHINGKLLLEDWIITATIPLTILASTCCWWAVKYGAGRHWWNIPVEMTLASMTPEAKAFPYTWIWGHLYWIIALLVKVSIIRFYFRLSPSQNFHRACWASLAFVVSSGLALGIAAFVSCTPIKANWEIVDPLKVKCFDTTAFYRAQATIHVIGDLVVLVLPLPMLIRMDRPLVQKMHVLGVFLLGGFVAFCSVFRLVLISLSGVEKFAKDFMYYGAYVMIWTTLELNVGIIASCLPAMKHGLSHLFPSVFALRTGSSRSVPPSLPICTIGSDHKPDPGQTQNPHTHIEGMDQLDSDDEEDSYHRRHQNTDVEKGGSRFEIMRQKSESEEQIMKIEMRVMRSSMGSGSTGLDSPRRLEHEVPIQR